MSITYPARYEHPETVQYVGAVFGTAEYNGYDDSDFYAVVWDDENGRMRTVTYDTTRCASSGARVTDDITEENAAKARAWLRPLRIRDYREQLEAAARRVERGARVRSVTTRGKNVGIEGVVKWIGPDQYRKGALRVGIQVEGEPKLRYMPEHSVERLDVEGVDMAAIESLVDARLSSVRGIFNTYRAQSLPRGFVLV